MATARLMTNRVCYCPTLLNQSA